MYVLRCGDGTLYTGIARDVARRLAQHADGRGARYTRGRGPFQVAYTEACPDRTAAQARERAIKRLSRAQKEALIATQARDHSIHKVATTPSRARPTDARAARRTANQEGTGVRDTYDEEGKREARLDADRAAGGILYLCPTPIGNLEDITLRVIRVLGEADLVLAEDTRRTGLLLRHLGLHKPMRSYHDHNERNRIPEVLAALQAGARVALVSDAGSPVLSDPGFLIVRAAVEAGQRVEALPGPTALVPALTGSGLPPHPFLFLGFPPRTTQRRRRLFASVATLAATLVMYEAPHRIHATMRDALEVLGPRAACVAREISKVHETYHRGQLDTLIETLSANAQGEMVLLIAGATESVHRGKGESPND